MSGHLFLHFKFLISDSGVVVNTSNVHVCVYCYVFVYVEPACIVWFYYACSCTVAQPQFCSATYRKACLSVCNTAKLGIKPLGGQGIW